MPQPARPARVSSAASARTVARAPAARRGPLRVLYAASEAWPLVKTGGLADVAGALPAALRGLGVDARLLLPAYPQALERLGPVRVVASTSLYGEAVTVYAGTLAESGVPAYLVHSASLSRPGDPYLDDTGAPWADNPWRFALLSRVGAALALGHLDAGWRADVVHANDWQTGLLPALLSEARDRPGSVFTIHNLAYRGEAPAADAVRLGLPPWWAHRYEALEFHGGVALIKGGLVYADRVTTVSPTYAREILTPPAGAGLDGTLRARGQALSGIVNGIDTQAWNPATDAHLPARYDRADRTGKARCKAALQAALGLEVNPDRPLLAFVGRLAEQKGVDLLLAALVGSAPGGAGWQVAVLGSGEARYATALRAWAGQGGGQRALVLGYDEGLAHRMQAGADALVVPSRYEPCGLVQLCALRYGTVPIVTPVGGLADTVTDPRAGTVARPATGVVAAAVSVPALEAALARALHLHADAPAWQALTDAGMAQDVSWNAPARAYRALYRTLG